MVLIDFLSRQLGDKSDPHPNNFHLIQYKGYVEGELPK